MKRSVIVLLVLVLFLAGCSTQSAQISQTQTPPQATPVEAPQPQQAQQPTPTETAPHPGMVAIKDDITIAHFAFSPGTVTIPAGTTIIWTNQDSVPHTVTSDTGKELSSDQLAQGQTYTHTFNTPGMYEYHCAVHPSMKGKVIVEASTMPTGTR